LAEFARWQDRGEVMKTTDLVFRVVSDPADVPRKRLPARANELERSIAELKQDNAELEFQLKVVLQQLAQRN
jgi:hypothetical protein